MTGEIRVERRVRAKTAYLAAIICLGMLALAGGVVPWDSDDPVRFVIYLALAVLTSGLKVRLPGVNGSLSVNFVMVLLCVAELTLSETLAIGAASFVTQSLWRVKRKSFIHVLFNVSNASICLALAHAVYRSGTLQDLGILVPLALVAAAVTYFVTNTFLVAGIIAVTESKSLLQVWKQCYFWSFPYYLAGASVGWILISLNAAHGWQAVMVCLPVVYGVYWSYCLYIARLAAEKRQAEVKAQFLANMSHEIRSPINGVLGMAELLLGSRRLDGQDRERVTDLRNSAAALATVVEDILEFSRMEAGRLALTTSLVDVPQLVREVCEIVRPEAEHKGLTFRCETPVGFPPAVQGHAVGIRRVLLVLLSNAVKFTAAGSVTVRVSPDRGAAGLRVEVTDTGIGIRTDDCARLFQPFTQLDSSDRRRFSGTGLGLSIAKRLVDLMDGQIGVTSTVGTGSTFWFTVPVEKVASETAAEERLERSNPEVGRILVVEDNKVNQRVTVGLLEKLGYEVEAVDDGEQAVARVLSRRYGLVLMDCQMPVMDGLTATREIRNRESGYRTPIVALTAGAFDCDEATCKAAGMDGFLAKPLFAGRLTDAVGRWVPPPPAGADSRCQTTASP